MPDSSEAFLEAMRNGHSAAWDRKWEQAAEAYQRALIESPKNPKALTSLGLALYELQRYDESLEAYKKAAQVSPRDPIPLEKVGQLSERLGNIQGAIQAFLRAAELHVQEQNSEKALENWMRITQLDSQNVTARVYLAMVHERLGHIPQSINEYLAAAALYQRSGNPAKATEMITRAGQLSPHSQEVHQAETLLKSGQLLPRPLHRQGGTGALRLAQVKQLEPSKSADSGLDPVAEGRKQVLTRLAEFLFDLSEEASASPVVSKRGMQSIMHDTEPLKIQQSDRARTMQYLGQAIDAQMKDQDAQAAELLEKAEAAGFTDASVYFDLGLLFSKTAQLDKALHGLQIAVKHKDYALPSRLLLAEIQHQSGRLVEESVEYLEALKIADSQVVPSEQSNEIHQLYEPLIEAQATQTDTEKVEQLSRNIKELLLRPDWRAAVNQAREQLPKYAEGAVPLAEILTQAQSGQVIEAVAKVRQLAREGHLRSAMDEAFESFKLAPTYLPLHTLVADLLIQDGRPQDAITKYAVVAQAYSVRGEAVQAINLLRKVIQVAPMDLSARSHLIDQLAARGQVDEAIGEYLDLADIYYRLAELDMARKTYTTALRLAQQGGANRSWSVKLLKRMADIDMQHLDWRQALRVFEQLRTLEPGDIAVRKDLIELNLRLDQKPQATAELENLLAHLESVGKRREAIPFLEELAGENPQQDMLLLALAEEYHQANRLKDAIALLDKLGERLLNSGNQEGAAQVLEAIIAMNPPNVVNYRALLLKLRPVS